MNGHISVLSSIEDAGKYLFKVYLEIPEFPGVLPEEQPPIYLRHGGIFYSTGTKLPGLKMIVPRRSIEPMGGCPPGRIKPLKADSYENSGSGSTPWSAYSEFIYKVGFIAPLGSFLTFGGMRSFLEVHKTKLSRIHGLAPNMH
jgi:hypothetical protein